MTKNRLTRQGIIWLYGCMGVWLAWHVPGSSLASCLYPAACLLASLASMI